ncbi:S1 family peptidase [Corynebacterium urogenitale]
MRPSARLTVGRRVLAAMSMVLTVLAGAVVTPAAQAQSALPSSPAQAWDQFLTVTGEPGPHRVAGHYFTSPVPPKAQEKIRPQALIGPSTPILVGDNACTIAVAGYDNAGNKVAITAGHCGKPGAGVISADAAEAGKIGTFVRAGAPDYGVIKLNPNVQLTNSYGAARISKLGGPLPASFAQACKTGISTGTTCGPVIGSSGPYILAHVCGSHGDSGGPFYRNGRLLGIVSGGVGNLPSCTTPLQGPLHAPTAAVSWNTIKAGLDANGGVGVGFRLA